MKVVVLVLATEPVVVVVVRRVFVSRGDPETVVVVGVTDVWKPGVVVAELVAEVVDTTVLAVVVVVVVRG